MGIILAEINSIDLSDDFVLDLEPQFLSSLNYTNSFVQEESIIQRKQEKYSYRLFCLDTIKINNWDFKE